RMSDGIRSIGEVKVGDTLYDEKGLPTLCLGVGPVETGPLKEIRYQEFDSREEKLFRCTQDHILPMKTYRTKPSLSKRVLTWCTRCDRTERRTGLDDLQREDIIGSIYRDLTDIEGEEPVSEVAYNRIDS